MKRSLTSAILSVASGKFVALILGIIASPLLYRWLGEVDYGAYVTVLSAHSMFMIVVSTPIADGVRKYVAEDRDDPAWERIVVGFYFRLATLLALLGAVVLGGVTYLGFFEWLWREEFTLYFYITIALVITAQYWPFARKTLMGFGLERYSESLKILFNVSFVAIALPLVYLGYGVVGALLGHILSSGLVALVGLVVLHYRQSLRGVFETNERMLPKREMMTFNSLSIVLVFLLMSLYHIDILMLQAMASEEAPGHYKAALVFAEFLWFAPIVLQTVFVHSTSELWSQGKVDQISEVAGRTLRYTFLITAVMALGMAALADAAIPIYWGPGSEPVIAPLLLLLPGAVGFALARPMLAIAQGKGELRYPIIATGAAAMINLVLNAALIPTYGMHGAAIATSIGYGSMAIFHLWSARKTGFDPITNARYGRVAATTAVAAVPIFLMADALSMPIGIPIVGAVPISVFVVPPAGLLVFLAIAVLFRALELTEIVRILTEFPEPIGSKARPLCRRLRNADDESGLLRYF